MDIQQDILGKDITVGDYVAFPDGNSTVGLGVVTKINPKMLQISNFNGSKKKLSKYANGCVILNATDVTFYILNNGK